MNSFLSTIVGLLLAFQIGGSASIGGGAALGGTSTSSAPLVPTHIQSCPGYGASGSVSSVVCTWSVGTVGVGDQLLIGWDNSVNTSVVTYSGDTGTVTVDLANSFSSTVNNYQNIAHIATAGGGGTTFTLNFSPAGSFVPLAVDEFTNVCAIDIAPSTAVGTGTAVTSATITPTFNGDLIFMHGETQTAQSPTPTGGAVLGANNFPTLGGFSWNIYFVQTTAAPISLSATVGTASAWGAVIEAFKHC